MKTQQVEQAALQKRNSPSVFTTSGPTGWPVHPRVTPRSYGQLGQEALGRPWVLTWCRRCPLSPRGPGPGGPSPGSSLQWGTPRWAPAPSVGRSHPRSRAPQGRPASGALASCGLRQLLSTWRTNITTCCKSRPQGKCKTPPALTGETPSANMFRSTSATDLKLRN